VKPIEIELEEATVINLTLRAKIESRSMSHIVSDAIREYSANHPVSNDDIEAISCDIAKEEVVILAALKSIQSLAPGLTMDPETTIAFYHMLDEAFGDRWHSNDDPRYTDELKFRPIDVIAPLDQHPPLINIATTIETRMRQEFNTRVLIFVVDEAPTSQN
jgi:hypothetical protein